MGKFGVMVCKVGVHECRAAACNSAPHRDQRTAKKKPLSPTATGKISRNLRARRTDLAPRAASHCRRLQEAITRLHGMEEALAEYSEFGGRQAGLLKLHLQRKEQALKSEMAKSEEIKRARRTVCFETVPTVYLP